MATQTPLTTSLCLYCGSKPATMKTNYAHDHPNTPNHLHMPKVVVEVVVVVVVNDE